MKHDPNIVVGEPSLASLSYILRHKELWPAGFWWDFSQCSHCAMAIARRVWTERKPIEVLFGIPESHAAEMFTYVGYGQEGYSPAISPERVADKIDGYLAGDMTQ